MTVVDSARALYQRCFSRIDAKESTLAAAFELKRHNKTISKTTEGKLEYIFVRTLGLTLTEKALNATAEQIRFSTTIHSGMKQGQAKEALGTLLLTMESRLSASRTRLDKWNDFQDKLDDLGLGAQR